MICPKCNSNNQEGSQFCNICGNPLNDNTTINSQKQKKTFNIWYLVIILLIVVIGLLSLLIINSSNENNLGKKKDDTRTIMIYLVGSNLEYEGGIVTADLDAIDTDQIDLEKTNILLYTGGTKEWHNFINNDENAIYILKDNGFEKIESYPKRNMGDASTLSEFLNYSYENYKAGHFNLIFYNHGGAIDGAIYDDFTNDNLSLEDFSNALSQSPFNKDNKIDLVIFRTCLNGTLEVANTFKDYSEYITFSEEVTWGSNKSNVLGYFINNLPSSADGIETGKKFVDAYVKQMSDIDPFEVNLITYSVINLSKIDNVINEFDNYIKGIDITSSYNNLSKIRSDLFQYGNIFNEYDSIDLLEFIDKTKDISNVDQTKAKKALESAIVYNYSTEDTSHGLSLYFPYKGNVLVKDRFLKVYNKLDILPNYKKLITQFSSIQDGSTPFAYDFTQNNIEKDENTKEVSIELTDEEMKNYTQSKYLIFRRNEEHPNYYQLIYNSNDTKLNGNKLSTNINNNLIKMSDGENSIYIHVNNEVSGSYQKRTTTGILYDKDEELFSGNYSTPATLSIVDENGKPKFGTAEKISRDERVEGVMFDLDRFEYMAYIKSEYRILDNNGKLLSSDDWESIPTRSGLEADLPVSLEYTGMDDGEFYCLFIIYDINNQGYFSDLIKVG